MRTYEGVPVKAVDRKQLALAKHIRSAAKLTQSALTVLLTVKDGGQWVNYVSSSRGNLKKAARGINFRNPLWPVIKGIDDALGRIRTRDDKKRIAAQLTKISNALIHIHGKIQAGKYR